ncbi:histidinol dehydrogenase [Caminicella sporogenes DSM 14501]|uniref:Histidinol dehydrogenase n=1 Tax=Caminicella sporogenes DSM 14501 TaxID=1121266 RepID=A0A1M6S4I6_9FIRM|nr:histidinol dehydrogenase [Caminicella sporogenes]RKD27191.1 histidinol dehydrogenase [Caminicella sporogenes]SHK39591.1 histidinol dehydrogenase [Caminicella sporogenes DSM 14501]
MKIVELCDKSYKDVLNNLLKRDIEDFYEIDKNIIAILRNVKDFKDKALYDYTFKFDGVKIDNIKVTEDEVKEALDTVDNQFLDILKKAKYNIERFHKRQIEKSWIEHEKKGIILGQLIRPLDRVGIYVPGGTASYPSSVLMNSIPAMIAGVKSIAMVTPPDKRGKVNPNILAAAYIAGIDEIYKVGGAQAIGALAYGTETIKQVQKIVGPGNIYVARAKKEVFGIVDIDMIAGPSEICIIADKNSNPRYIAADLLSQAEHDQFAFLVLFTNSIDLAESVKKEVIKQLDKLERKEIAEKSIGNNGYIFIVDSIDKAIEISNEIAPEHLEIMVDNPFGLISRIKNAGAVFLGSFTPEPVGDYFAGPNHTLPTSGTAKFSSPLGVYDFVKKTSLIYYTKESLKEIKDDVIYFSKIEGLTAHGNSIRVRFE